MLVERPFTVSAGNAAVPAVLWSDEDVDGPQPLVLMGHGRADGKRSPPLVSAARRLVERHGLSVVSVDAPGHGERRPPGARGAPPKPDVEQTASEWRACLDGLIEEGTADAASVGYWGFSMGAALGIALLAGEPRIRCAALGLMHPDYYPRLLADAGRVRCPILFSLHWDDARVPRGGAFTLFDAFASPDKRLHAYPGDHADFSEEEFLAAERFLATCLSRDARR